MTLPPQDIVIPFPAVKELIDAATRIVEGERNKYSWRDLEIALDECKLAAWRQGQ